MTQAAVLAQMGNQNQTFRNRIINGSMMIDQRNAGASSTPSTTGYVTVDRYEYVASQASKFTVGQNLNSVTPPTGFTKYLGFQTASSVSVGSGDYFFFQQKIEGQNIPDFGWGAVGASTAMLSFWVRSSLTGTFGGAVTNSATDRSYPFSYTINSANTWEYKTVTIIGDTTGTWLTTNGIGLILRLSLGMGSTYAGTANTWAASNLASSTGAVSVVGTGSATFYITGVQLEKGTVATPFEQRFYGTELALCQRYCYALPSNTNTTTYQISGVGYELPITLPVTMRTTPSITQPTFTYVNSSTGSITAQNANIIGLKALSTANNYVQVFTSSTAIVSAEL